MRNWKVMMKTMITGRSNDNVDGAYNERRYRLPALKPRLFDLSPTDLRREAKKAASITDRRR